MPGSESREWKVPDYLGNLVRHCFKVIKEDLGGMSMREARPNV